MKVITIGTDRKLFEEGSAVRARAMQYAAGMDELHIVVMSLSSLRLSETHIGNLHIYPTSSHFRLSYIWDAYRLGKRIARERNLLPESSVVSAQDPFETGLPAYFLHKKFGLPLQLQIHTDLFDARFRRHSLLNRIRVAIARHIIPRAQGIRVVSEPIMMSLQGEFPSLSASVDILPIFVDSEAIASAISEKNVRNLYPHFSCIVVMVSRLAPEKRIDVALSVFKRVLEAIPGAGLIVVGDGPERKHLEICAESYGLTGSVVFAGWQDPIPYYKAADAFLFSSEYEGYGMSLVEAAAAGVPIVSTKVGIASTTLCEDGQNCFLCQPGDADCLAEKLIILLQDPALRELFKSRMKDSIRNVLSKEAYAAKYLALLRKLLP
jgi:glycosyltransferase involved in cell wall biosynthesis